MDYLTYDEYIQLGFAEIEKTEFDRLLPKASDVINSVTRDFYVFNDIEDDVPFRRERFKKRSEEHTSELQSRPHLVCRLLLEKKKKQQNKINAPLTNQIIPLQSQTT